MEEVFSYRRSGQYNNSSAEDVRRTPIHLQKMWTGQQFRCRRCGKQTNSMADVSASTTVKSIWHFSFLNFFCIILFPRSFMTFFWSYRLWCQLDEFPTDFLESFPLYCHTGFVLQWAYQESGQNSQPTGLGCPKDPRCIHLKRLLRPLMRECLG